MFVLWYGEVGDVEFFGVGEFFGFVVGVDYDYFGREIGMMSGFEEGVKI